jgi:hypothetical protein
VKFLAPLTRGEVIIGTVAILLVGFSTINKFWGAGSKSPEWLVPVNCAGLSLLLIVHAYRIISYRRAQRRNTYHDRPVHPNDW